MIGIVRAAGGILKELATCRFSLLNWRTNSSGFKASSFAPLAAPEGGHFWFRVRNALIIWALGKYGASVSSFMEIGCGTGFVLQGIARGFPKMHLAGSEIYPEGIAFAAERIMGGKFMQMDARQIPICR